MSRIGWEIGKLSMPALVLPLVLTSCNAGAPGTAAATPAATEPRSIERTPVLEFPEPGLDDASAYRGYHTRLFRDAADNTFQIYVDADGRVVHLWADAANESLSFSARDGQGGAASLEWAGDGARVWTDGAQRVVAHGLRYDGSELRLGHFLLGSMREERDFQYQQADLRALDADPFVLPELTTLVDELSRLPAAERAEHVRLLGARDTAELRSRLGHELELSSGDDAWTFTVARRSLDARNRLVLELGGDAHRSRASLEDGGLVIRSLDGSPILLRVAARTDARALHPLDRTDIFTSDFLAWLERARLDGVAARTEGSAPTADAWVRYRRLERGVRGVELLASREKLMAGLPNFATYFGRDMMMTALMMAPIWRADMLEHVLASVLGKVDASGDVSHEEALGGQAIREHAVEYVALLRAARARRNERDGQVADSLLSAARHRLANLQEVRENHHMLDDDLQLPVVAALWLADGRVPPERRRAFLLEEVGDEPRLAPLLRNLSLIAERTAPYARTRDVRDLISFRPRADGGWSSASWRDSGAGYAGGRYAMDVNAIWAPAALRATRQVLGELHRLGWTASELERVAPGTRTGPLGPWLEQPGELDAAIGMWSRAADHFRVRLSAEEARTRIDARLTALPEAERAYWVTVLARSGEPHAELRFLALSLDSAGAPIPVLNTDPATRLLLEDMTAAVMAGTMPADAVLEDVGAFARPYPAGLLIEGVGPVASNDAFAEPAVWRAFEDDTYHSPRAVWGREVNVLLLGLARQVESATDSAGRPLDPALATHVTELRSVIDRVTGAVDGSGLRHLELWSYEAGPDGVRPVRYGFSSDVQLWNVTDLAVRYVLDDIE